MMFDISKSSPIRYAKQTQAVGLTISLLLMAACLPSCADSDSKTKGVPEGSAVNSAVNKAVNKAPTAAEDDRSYLAVLKDIDPEKNLYVNRLRSEFYTEKAQVAGKSIDGIRYFQLSADEYAKAGDPSRALRRLDNLLKQIPTKKNAFLTDFESKLRWSAATAALRKGELENCIQEKCCDSCVFPIKGGGVHIRPEGSRRAIQEVEWLLAREPNRADLIWLRNLLGMTLGEWPDQVPKKYRIEPEAFADDLQIERFRDIAPSVGLDVVGLSGGACMEDFDLDGHLDVFMTSWGSQDPCRFFRSDGQGKFEDRTQAAGLTGITGGLNCVHADYDNDGDADILILRGAWLMSIGRLPNTLLRNDGGRFVDVTLSSGIHSLHPTQTAVWGDYDLDGDLDLFIGNETTKGQTHPCELFENQGDGTFVNVAQEVGLAHEAWVKGVAWADIDNDNDLDLYVSVLGGANALYENLGSKNGERPRFRNIAQSAGVQEPRFSFPTWFFDYDQDGKLDLLVGSYGNFKDNRLAGVASAYLGRKSHDEGIKLFRNLGGNKFEDVSKATSIGLPVLPMGSNFGDIDGDGWLDVYFGTGAPSLATLVPNRMFRNDHGKRFQEVTTSGGFGHLQKGHGIAFGDIDHDGDQDIFMTMGGAFEGDTFANLLFENPSPGHRWLHLKLEGTKSSRDAHDARVQVTIDTPEGSRTLHRVIGTGGSFGASSLQLEIGLGDAQKIREVKVTWPVTGTVRYTGFELDRVYHLKESNDSPVEIPIQKFNLGG